MKPIPLLLAALLAGCSAVPTKDRATYGLQLTQQACRVDVERTAIVIAESTGALPEFANHYNLAKKMCVGKFSQVMGNGEQVAAVEVLVNVDESKKLGSAKALTDGKTTRFACTIADGTCRTKDDWQKFEDGLMKD